MDWIDELEVRVDSADLNKLQWVMPPNLALYAHELKRLIAVAKAARDLMQRAPVDMLHGEVTCIYCDAPVNEIWEPNNEDHREDCQWKIVDEALEGDAEGAR